MSMYTIAGIAWAILAGLTVGYEIWALATHGSTLSEWVWHVEATRQWFRILIFLGCAMLLYHFVFQKNY